MSFITDIFRKIFVGTPAPAPAPVEVTPAPVVEAKSPTQEEIKATVERVVNKTAVKKPAAKKANVVAKTAKATKSPKKAK